MSSLQNITFTQSTRRNVNTIQVQFQYRKEVADEWRTFTYSIPEDMFDIRVDDREQLAIQIIRAIAIGKGHMDEEGNILVS